MSYLCFPILARGMHLPGPRQFENFYERDTVTMRRFAPHPVRMAVLLAAIAFAWTGNPRGASSSILDNELQLSQERCVGVERCPASDGFQTHWISRTLGGNLFLVIQAHCQTAEQCAASFVERTARGSNTRLNIRGQFRVLHSGKPIPDVQTWRRVSAAETEYTRYTWVNGAYLKADTHTAYSVDGVECGTALECYQAANQAQAQQRTGKALKILEQVHNVSFI